MGVLDKDGGLFSGLFRPISPDFLSAFQAQESQGAKKGGLGLSQELGYPALGAISRVPGAAARSVPGSGQGPHSFFSRS